MRVKVTHTLHDSRDGLVTEEEALNLNRYVELGAYVKAGTTGTFNGEFIEGDDGYEYYVPEEYFVKI